MNVLIKDIPLNERPRERLINKGVEYLSNEDLLAILLKTGTKENSVKVLANNILKQLDDINNLKEINLEEVDKYIEEGQFAPGSMLPKVEACKKFVLSGDKKVAIIASLTNAKAALRGESGTKIVK